MKISVVQAQSFPTMPLTVTGPLEPFHLHMVLLHLGLVCPHLPHVALLLALHLIPHPTYIALLPAHLCPSSSIKRTLLFLNNSLNMSLTGINSRIIDPIALEDQPGLTKQLPQSMPKIILKVTLVKQIILIKLLPITTLLVILKCT